MKKFWMSMLCVLALTLFVGFVGCSKENSKDKGNGNSQSQTYEDDDEYTNNY